ncbi:microfibril-associated glycoprotein 4-like [Mytilus trossulus]|uniref:microfibril-associated glycoprotein 4-like n=1 Tax=Mytilus trossulus TaxID=6551 RepID=UPI00300503A4
MTSTKLVGHLIVLVYGSLCFGNPDGTYIAPLIDDTQRAPLVALLNTSDISQNIMNSFGKQLNEKVNDSINEKMGDIHRRIQKVEETCEHIERDRSSGNGNRKDIRDCRDLPNDYRSGIYKIKPDHTEEFDVYCEMTVDHGGWTVIQRRESGDLDFYQGWEKYKTGFGQLNREFWLGNDKIHTLTSQGRYELLIGLADFDNNQAYAKYQHFYIGNETSKYKINIYGYSGSAGDNLNYHNGMPFTTFDRDSDLDHRNCALTVNGAWWFTNCFESHLNGHYFIRTPSKAWRGIIWKDWKGPNHSLRATEMMIRRL